MSAANQQISRLRADLKRAKTGKATLYNNLGVLLRENGRPAEALRAHRRELTLGRQQNSMLDIALAHHFCGLCLTALDRPVCAVKEHKAAFEYSAAAPACKQSVIIQIRALNNLGLTCLECADAALQQEVDSENELSSSSSTTMAQWLSNPHAQDLSQSMQKLDDMMKSDQGSEHMRATCGELYTRQGMHYLFHALDLINESDESIFDRGRFDKLMQLRDTYVNMSNVVLHSSINSTRAALLFLDSALRVQNQLKQDLESSQPWVQEVAKKQRNKVETFVSVLKSELTIKIGETHSTLGTVYQTRHDFSKALKHFNIDADAAKAENYAVDGGRSIYNIGVLYLNQSNLPEAKKYFKEAQRIATRTNNNDFADTVQEAIQNLSSSHDALAQSEKFKNELAAIEIDWQNFTAGGKNELSKFSKLLSRKFDKLNALASSMLFECNQTFDAFCFAQRAFSLGSDVLAFLALICEASSQNDNIFLDLALDLHRTLLKWKHIKIQLPNQPHLSSELYAEWDLSLLQTSLSNILTTHIKLPQSMSNELISMFKTAEKALLNSFTVMIDSNSKMRSIERCVQLSGAYCALLQCKTLYLHRRRLEFGDTTCPVQFMYLLLARESESLCDWRDGLLQQLYLSRLHQIEAHFEHRIKKQANISANFSLKAVADLTWLVCLWCRQVLEEMISWKSNVDADVVKSSLQNIDPSLLDAYCSDDEGESHSKGVSSLSSWLSRTVFECVETLNSELRETRFVAARVIDLLMQWNSLSIGAIDSESTHDIYLPSPADRCLVSGDSFGSRTVSASISAIDSTAAWLLKSWHLHEFDASQLSNYSIAIVEKSSLNSLLELSRFSQLIDATLPICSSDDQYSLHGAPRLPNTELEVAKFPVDDLDISNSDVDSDFATDQIDKVRASYRRHLQRRNTPKTIVSAPLKQAARSIVAASSNTLRPIGDSDDEFVASSDDQSDSDRSDGRESRHTKSNEKRSTKSKKDDRPQPNVAVSAVPRSKKSIVESDDDEPLVSAPQPRSWIVVESQDSESQAEYTNAVLPPTAFTEKMTSFNSATSDRIPELNNASLKSAFRELSRLLPASSGELNTSSQPRTARISSNEQSAFLAADLESDDGQDDESDNEASDADFVEEEELSGDDEEVSNHDLRHVYNDAIAYKDWKVAGDNANCLAHRFLSQGDVQSALKWFDRDLQASKQLMSQWTQSKRTTNGHILCSTHQYLGECYRQLGDFDQAIKQHQEQKRLCNQCKDSPNFECFTELQRCEVELGEDYFRWAEHLGEEIEGLRKRIRAEADIEHKQALRSKSESITLQIKTHYEASLKHRKAALEMAERKGSLLLRARSHTNLGLVLAALNKCDDAIVEYNRALKCAFEMTSKHPLAPELPILDIESLVSEHFSEEHEMQYVKSLNDKQKHQREMSLVERSRAHCGLAAVYMDYLKPPVVSQALLHLQTDLALCVASRDYRGLVSTLNNLTRFCLLREVGPQHVAAAHFVNLALKHTVDVAASVRRVCDANGVVDFLHSGIGDADAEMVDNRIRALRLQQELPDDLIVATQAELSSKNVPKSAALAESGVDTKAQLKSRFQKAKQLLAEFEKLFMDAEYSDSDLLECAQRECESILKSISSDDLILRRKTLEMYYSVLQSLLKLHQRPNAASGPAQASQILKLKQLHRNAQNELDRLSESAKPEAPLPPFAARVSENVLDDLASGESNVRASALGAKQSNSRKSKSNAQSLPQLARRLNARESDSPVQETSDRFIIADDEPSTDEEIADEQRHHEHDVGYFLQMNRKLQQKDERLREKREQQNTSKQSRQSEHSHDKSSSSKPTNIHDYFPTARQNSITISSSDDESNWQSFDMDFEAPAVSEQVTLDSFPTFNSIARTIKPSQRLENRKEQPTTVHHPATVKPVEKPSRFRRIDSGEFESQSLKAPIPRLYRIFKSSAAPEPALAPAPAPSSVDKRVDKSAISDEALLKTLPIQFQQKLKKQPQQPSTANTQSSVASSTMVHVCIGKERVAVFVPPLVQVNSAAASHNLSGASVLTKARPPTVAWLMTEAANRYLQLTNRQCEIARMRFQSALVLPSDSLLNLIAGNSGTASVFEAELASQRNRTLHECYLACVKDFPEFQQHALLGERLLKFSSKSSTILNLSAMQLRSVDLSYVLAALQTVSDLENNAIVVNELNLACNFIDDEFLVDLVNILNAPGSSDTEPNRLRTIVCRLQTLNLSNNMFTSKGLSHFLSSFPLLLSEGMSSFSLKSINVSGLLLGWDSLKHLQAMFQVCKNLEHLDMSYCSVDQDGQHNHNSLNDAIISLCATLKYLNLSGNRFISDVALNTLLQAILEGRYPQLIDIRLNSMCSLTNFKLSSVTLFDLLSASRLQSVELDDWNWQLNSFNNKMCHASSSIQNVSLRRSVSLPCQYLSALLNSFSGGNVLTLCLDGCQLNRQCWSALIQCVEAANSVQHLSLQGIRFQNPMDEHVESELVISLIDTACKTNRGFSVDLSGTKLNVAVFLRLVSLVHNRSSSKSSKLSLALSRCFAPGSLVLALSEPTVSHPDIESVLYSNLRKIIQSDAAFDREFVVCKALKQTWPRIKLSLSPNAGLETVLKISSV